MSDENKEITELGKSFNKTVYAEDRATRIARELGYSDMSKMANMANEIREELLQDNGIIILNTGVAEDAVEVIAADDAKLSNNIVLTGILEKKDTVVTNEADVVAFLQTKPDKLNETLKTRGYNLSNEQVNTLNKALQTAKDKLPNKANKMFHLATGSANVIGKTSKIASKTGGALIRFGKNFDIIDAEGNVNAIEAGENKIKTAARFVGRQAAKPVRKAAKKLNQKIVSKPVLKATAKVKKVEAKAMAKASKIGVKAVANISKIAIKVISKIIQAFVTLVISCFPAVAVVTVVLLIITIIANVFGFGLTDNELSKFTNYISETQATMQTEISNYANQGYKVDGTYSGTAYIDWKAALSTLQGLKNEITADDEEINLLKQWKKEKLLFYIDAVETDEYVRIPEIKDEKGNVIQEEVRTTTKYVVTIGTLDDYKKWIENNPEKVKKFYDKCHIKYNKKRTNFLTDDTELIIDELYESDDFGMFLEGIEFDKNSINKGTIYDTGEHKGKLAYPTSYRKISASWPQYSSGKKHDGVDFPVPKGTPVCAAYDGTVYIAKNLEYSYGHYIVIKSNVDGQTIYTLYAHNTTLLANVGETVKQGQVIAYSGSTGNSTGPHCHFGVFTSWSPRVDVNPLDWL